MVRRTNDLVVEVLPLLLGLVLLFYLIGTWLTHVVVCIQTSAWGFLIAGAIFFPVGIVHGTGIWLGFW